MTAHIVAGLEIAGGHRPPLQGEGQFKHRPSSNMSRKEIIQQLEFFRDIGITSLSVSAPAATHVRLEQSSPTTTPPSEGLASIREDIGDCRRCKLAPTRTHIVFGSGNPNAELVFVGEAPGADEDEQGLPFVGRAGQLLTKIIDT